MDTPIKQEREREPKNYYYDDGTGYEIYEEEEDIEEEIEEDDNLKED
jgi:hypothetical protein